MPARQTSARQYPRAATRKKVAKKATARKPVKVVTDISVETTVKKEIRVAMILGRASCGDKFTAAMVVQPNGSVLCGAATSSYDYTESARNRAAKNLKPCMTSQQRQELIKYLSDVPTED